MFFKLEHVKPILSGDKTQTRRKINKSGKCPYKVGHIYQARLDYKAGAFAYLKITGVRQERLADMSEADCILEGYNGKAEYREIYERIYGAFDEMELLWVVDFVRTSQAEYLINKYKMPIGTLVKFHNCAEAELEKYQGVIWETRSVLWQLGCGAVVVLLKNAVNGEVKTGGFYVICLKRVGGPVKAEHRFDFSEKQIGMTFLKQYPFVCPVCGNDKNTAAPSLFMDMGINSGSVSCPVCKSLLHVYINESNTAMEILDVRVIKNGGVMDEDGRYRLDGQVIS